MLMEARLPRPQPHSIPLLATVRLTCTPPTSMRLSDQVNSVAKHGCTPLYFAAYNGHTLALRTLLARGANPALADEKGKKPQDVACDGGNAANKVSLISLFSIPADKLKAK